MQELKRQPKHRLRSPEEISRKDPSLNPYSTKIKDHQSMIWYNEAPLTPEEASFLTAAPLVVDLGCGSGNFIRQYAKQQPETHFIGFELRFKRLVKAAEKYEKDGLTNVRLVRARAEEVASWLPAGSVKLLHINFPDPWAKKRQKKHRLVSPEFLQVIHQLLAPAGRFVFKTDHREYYLSSLDFLCEDAGFKVNHMTCDLHSTDIFNIETEFEGLFKSQNLKVCYVELQKI